MLFNEIDNFIEVYNNSVIELIQCFGTSFFGRINHLANSVIKFRPKNSVQKHYIRSITYNYCIIVGIDNILGIQPAYLSISGVVRPSERTRIYN